MTTKTREILETRSPQATQSIHRAADAAAVSLSILDREMCSLEERAAMVRQHLAFEIEKAELAIERAEWESRADTTASRERLQRLRANLEAISPEALMAARQPLAEIWQSLSDLKAGE